MTDQIQTQGRSSVGCLGYLLVAAFICSSLLAVHFHKMLKLEREVFQFEERAKQATGPCGTTDVQVLRTPGQDVRFAIAGLIVTPEEFVHYRIYQPEEGCLYVIHFDDKGERVVMTRGNCGVEAGEEVPTPPLEPTTLDLLPAQWDI